MNPRVYRIVATQFGKVRTLRLRSGTLAYYDDQQTARRALSQLRCQYPDAMIQYTSGDWRTADGG